MTFKQKINKDLQMNSEAVMKDIKFPDASCRYEIYDAETLKPENESTYVRLMELGWSQEDFAGKTVLDIGCNSGALSVYASQLGAKHIKSVDIQTELVSFFSKVVKEHSLPISVASAGVNDLDPQKDKADIVLLMEVLHWLVDQGMTVADSISKIASLTAETLYIETPWDISEPAIARKGIIKHSDYNMDLIINELSKHFENVCFVRFMTYFGRMKDSRRVLIRASGRRTAALSLSKLRDANLVSVSLVRGSNHIEMVTTPDGVKVLKTLPRNSAILKLPNKTLEDIFAVLALDSNKVIVTPERIGESVLYLAEDGHSYMLFPFVGELSNFFPKPLAHKPVQEPLQVALDVRRALRGVSTNTINTLREHTPKLPMIDLSALYATIGERSDAIRLKEFLREMIAHKDKVTMETLDAVIHGDLQSGNMLTSPMGEPKVVDLDLIRCGMIYSDILTCAIFFGLSFDEVSKAISIAVAEETRALSKLDIVHAVNHCLGWFRNSIKTEDSSWELRVKRTLMGFDTMMQLNQLLS